MNDLPIQNEKHKIVARVREHTLCMVVRGGTHGFTNPAPAWWVVRNYVIDGLTAGAEWLELYDLDTKRVYRMSIERLLHKGLERQRGGRSILVLPMGEWEILSEGVVTSFGKSAHSQQSEPAQVLDATPKPRGRRRTQPARI